MTVIFRVADEVFSNFPTYVVGCVVVTGIDNTRERPAIRQLHESAILRSRAVYGISDLKSHLPFSTWRTVISAAGWSPSRFPASVEAMHRRVQKGQQIPSINPAVDVANAAVLSYDVPIGTHDIASFDSHPLEVRLSDRRDRFTAMDGSDDAPVAPEIVYAAGKDIRTRRWVWRQSQTALVSNLASNIFYPIDGFDPDTYHAVCAAMNFIAETCRSHLSENVEIGLVTAQYPEFSAETVASGG